MDKTC